MKLILIFFSVFLFHLCVSQPALNRVYGSGTENTGYSIIPETNGYTIVAGGYSAQFESGSDLWYAIKFYRIDSLGTVIFEKEFGKVAQAYEPAYDGAKKLHDKGYIISGRIRDSATGVYSGLLIKTDSTGDTLWTRIYTTGNATSFNDCLETPDRGFAIIGETTGLGDSNGDIYLVKLDSAGIFQWQKNMAVIKKMSDLKLN